jgi:hypothetical protein
MRGDGARGKMRGDGCPMRGERGQVRGARGQVRGLNETSVVIRALTRRLRAGAPEPVEVSR